MLKQLCFMVFIPLVIFIFGATSTLSQQETRDALQRITQAKEYLEKGRLTLAVALLDEVLKDDPKNLRAIAFLGRAYISVGQIDEAKPFLRRALEIEPNDPEVNLGMSVVLFLEGQYQRAKEYAPKALASKETTIDALNILGQIAVTQDSIYIARKYFEEILSLDSSHYDALTNLGILYQQAGIENTALSFFQKAVKSNPQRPSAYHNLGVLYGELERLHDAVIALNTASNLDSLSPKHFRVLGILFLRQGLVQEAVASFQQALNREFFDIESRIGMALSWWSLGEYDKALKEVNDMVIMGFQFNRMELFLANIYFQKKEYEKSIALAREDVKQNPAEAEGHYLLGMLYKLIGDEEKSNSEFTKATNISEKHPGTQLPFSVNSFFSAGQK